VLGITSIIGVKTESVWLQNATDKIAHGLSYFVCSPRLMRWKCISVVKVRKIYLRRRTHVKIAKAPRITKELGSGTELTIALSNKLASFRCPYKFM